MRRFALSTLAAAGVFTLIACEQQPETTVASRAIEAQRNFDRIDGNKDGVLSRSEASTFGGLDFEAADTDGNAALTPDEFEVAVLGTTPRG